MSDSEFIAVRKPERANWKTFRFSLARVMEALKASDDNPSANDQAAIFNLLKTNIEQVYGVKVDG